jgi:hypothetical protein
MSINSGVSCFFAGMGFSTRYELYRSPMDDTVVGQMLLLINNLFGGSFNVEGVNDILLILGAKMLICFERQHLDNKTLLIVLNLGIKFGFINISVNRTKSFIVYVD